MKKNVKTYLLATAILVSSIVGVAACNALPSGGGGGELKAKDVYAMSAVSSVAYLSAETDMGVQPAAFQSAGAFSALPAVDAARPSRIDDSDVDGIGKCLAMFDDVIAGGGFEQTVKENTSQDTLFSAYAYEMSITLHGESAVAQAYTMYFNELETWTETEKDDFEEETEVSTTFEGVIVYGAETFIVRGVKEVETEGREVETSITFRTYKNIGADSLHADERNFVQIEQSTEEGEIEYEYTFYKDGRKVRELELSYEQDRRGVEISFEIKNAGEGEREYEVRKGKNDDVFFVEFEKNGKEDRITVTKLEEGGYRFVYSNGFEERVNY